MKLSIGALLLTVGLTTGWMFRFLTEPASPTTRTIEPTPPKLSDHSGAAPLTVTYSPSERVEFTPAAPQSAEDLTSALRGTLSDPLPRRRLRTFMALLDQLTPQNAATIREQLANWPQKDQISKLCQNLFFERCGELEGLSAYEAVRQTEQYGSDGGRFLHAVLKGWATADLTAVRRYIDSLPENDGFRSFAMTAVIEALARQDLRAAGEYVRTQSFPDDGTALAMYQSLIREAEERNRADIFPDWFEQMPEGPAKPFLAKKTIDYLRAQSPEAAAEWLMRLGTPEWRNADLYWPTALAWAEKDPRAAFDWVVQLPPLGNDIAPPGFRAVIEAWNQKDPAAVIAWVSEHTSEPWWPRAASGVVKSFRRDHRDQDADAFLARFPQELQRVILTDLDIGPGGKNSRVP